MCNLCLLVLVLGCSFPWLGLGVGACVFGFRFSGFDLLGRGVLCLFVFDTICINT